MWDLVEFAEPELGILDDYEDFHVLIENLNAVIGDKRGKSFAVGRAVGQRALHFAFIDQSVLDLHEAVVLNVADLELSVELVDSPLFQDYLLLLLRNV